MPCVDIGKVQRRVRDLGRGAHGELSLHHRTLRVLFREEGANPLEDGVKLRLREAALLVSDDSSMIRLKTFQRWAARRISFG